MSDVIRLRRYAMMHAIGIPLLMVLTESARGRSAVLVFGIIMHIIYHIATERAIRRVAVAGTLDEIGRRQSDRQSVALAEKDPSSSPEQ